MNPLESNETFYMTLGNPNPTSSKTKDGPVYRVSFEMQQDEWQMFMDAVTKGMIVECAGQVTHRNHEEVKRDPKTVDMVGGVTDEEAKKGGALSIRSDALARDPNFIQYIRDRDPDYVVCKPDGETAETDAIVIGRTYIRDGCGVLSRRELDHDEQAANKFHKIIKNYTQWLVENSLG